MPELALPEQHLLMLEAKVGNIHQLSPLSGGHQNSWLLDATKGKFVFKPCAAQPLEGVDYQRQAQLLQQLGPRSWLPSVELDLLNQLGCLYPYISGKTPSLSELSAPDIWQQLLAILAQLAAEVGTVQLQLKPYLSNYLQALPEPSRSQALSWLAQLELPTTAGLNHHDLHLENLLLTEQGLVILDWEYAAFSVPGWDAASLAQRLKLDSDAEHALQLQSGLSIERFNELNLLVALLDLAWSWRYQQVTPQLNTRLEQWFAEAKLAKAPKM